MFDCKVESIKKFVERLASKSRLKSFYPESVSRALGISIDIVVIELGKLVQEDKLILKYEIRKIPELDILAIVDDYQSLIDTIVDFDGEEYKVSYANIYPVYYIDSDYRKYVQEAIEKPTKYP